MEIAIYVVSVVLGALSLGLVVAAIRHLLGGGTNTVRRGPDRDDYRLPTLTQSSRHTDSRDKRVAAMGARADAEGLPLARILDGARTATQCDAAIAIGSSDRDPPTVMSVGLSDDEAALVTSTVVSDHPGTRALEIAFRSGGPASILEPPIRWGLAVPLPDSSGVLAALSRSRLHRFTEEHVDILVALAAQAAPALERAQDESLPPRDFGELSSSIDLDEVLTRTLEAASSYPGVDAALVAVDDGSGPAVAAAIGMALDESPRPALATPPDGSRPRAISVVYEYEANNNPGDAIRAGISVPLLSHGELIGYIAVYTRRSVHLLGEAQARLLEELSVRAAPALQNARLFRDARQLADLDALTGLHNRRYFHETLAREVARAQRYERSLALVVIDLDDFKAVNDRIGHLAGDGVLAEAAERVRDVVRSADVACRVGGDEFAVILPESGIHDAEQLYQRLESAVSTRPVGQAGRLHLSAGISELRDDDDAISFFQRTDENLYRAKRAGKGAVQGDDSKGGAGELPPGKDPPAGPTPIRPVPDPPTQPPSASETAGSS